MTRVAGTTSSRRNRAHDDNYRPDLMKVERISSRRTDKGLTRCQRWARRAHLAVRFPESRSEVAARLGTGSPLRGASEAGDEEVVLDGPVPVHVGLSAPRIRDRVSPRGIPEPVP